MWRTSLRRVAAASTSPSLRCRGLAFMSRAELVLHQKRSEHVEEALRIVRAYATRRYEESVDLALILNVDAKQTHERVRGMATLPHGTGRSVRVAVFARDELAEEARAAGADVSALRTRGGAIACQPRLACLTATAKCPREPCRSWARRIL